MKTEKNILIAFVLNLGFSIFELLGGIWTGSVAIASDAIHDIGDAASIGLSYWLEKKSRKHPDRKYTCGYGRYSVLGGFLTGLILLAGSFWVIVRAIQKILTPSPIYYDGVILFAVVGVCVNLVAAYFTREGESLNQKAVNLHMLEDVLGWTVLLVGAIVMRFTDLWIIDPLLSLGVAIFILIHTVRNLGEIGDLFLMRTPKDVDTHEIEEKLLAIDGVVGVHHFRVWSVDGHHHQASAHLVVDGNPDPVKLYARKVLHEHGIAQITLETETQSQPCQEMEHTPVAKAVHCHHHHHHHHH